MKERDPDYWRVYGEGQKAVFSARQIFNNWNFIPHTEFPEFDAEMEAVIGLDFGFTNDDSSYFNFKKNDKLYLHELLYKTGMTNSDIVEYIKKLGYEQVLIFADAAEPVKSVEQIKREDC